MSWDVLLLHAPEKAAEWAEIEQVIDEQGLEALKPLGTAAEVRSLLLSLFPEMDLSEPGWPVLEGSDYSVEFQMDDDDPITILMLHVRGSDSSLDAIKKICLAASWDAVDCTTNNIMNFDDDPAEGLRKWRRYRDHVLREYENKDSKDESCDDHDPQNQEK